MTQVERLGSNLPIILVVDDIPSNLTLITDLLSGVCRCRVATSGEKALVLARNEPKPDLILLDVVMPGLNGYEVCKILKEDDATRDIPIIFLTALDGENDETEGFRVGGVDFITKPVSKSILLARINAHLIIKRGRQYLANRNETLERLITERTRQIAAMQDVIILAMASLAETRDNDTGSHIRRIQLYSQTLAHALRAKPACAHLVNDEFINLLVKTCPLHDIGKVGVPDSILFKMGRLDSIEFEEMKKHSFFGGQTLMEVERQLAAPQDFVAMAHEIALHHHERWDGTGYPLGLAGEQIPLSARIVALADTYDALTSARIYKPPYPQDDARRIVERERGRQFDPNIVDAFMLCSERFHEIAIQFEEADDAAGRRVQNLRHFLAE